MKAKEKKVKSDKSNKKDKNTDKKPSMNQKPQKAPVSKSKNIPPLVSIDVGSRYLKLVDGRFKGNRISIKGAYEHRLPDNACNDGKLLRRADVSGTIQNIIRENRISTKDAVCTIESTEIFQRELVVPRVQESEILSMVSFEIGQYLPIDISSYSLQYKIVSDFINDQGYQYKIIVCAMPRAISKEYMDMLSHINLKPGYMDVNTNSIEKILKLEYGNNPEMENNNLVLIDLGNLSINVSFYKGNAYMFNRILNMGGQLINDVISKNVEASSNEIEKIKINNFTNISSMDLYKAYGGNYDTLGATDDAGEIILRESTKIIDNWANEINNVLKYYTSRDVTNTLNEIIIYGGSSNIKDLDKFFENKFQIKTKRLEYLHCLDIDPKIQSLDISKYLNAIGALIRR